jgi:inner membrane protein
VIGPLLLTASLWAWDRWRRTGHVAHEAPLVVGRLFLASAVGVASHPFLDWLNTYGIRLLMPFDGRWFYGDAAFIVDPWLWLLLGGTVMLARRGRGPCARVWAVLGILTSIPVLWSGGVPGAAKATWVVGLSGLVLLRLLPRRADPRAVARAGVALAAFYVAALLLATTTASSWVMRELGRRGSADVEEVMVGPLPANPFVWKVVVRTEGEYRQGRLRWPVGPRLDLRERPTRIGSGALIQAARTAPCIAGTLGWMRFPFAEIENVPGGHTVHFVDLRYAGAGARGFGTAAVDLGSDLVPRGCATSR